MKRHSTTFVAAAAAAVFLATGALTSCSSGGTPTAAAGSKTLRVTLANHVWTETIKSKLSEFEKATGLKVEVSQYGEAQLNDQYNVKLNANTTDIDVMMYEPQQTGKLFAKNGWFADLSKDVNSNKDWNWNDFQAGPVEMTTDRGKTVGVPIVTEQEVLYYRKDLLQKAGLQVPKTMDELQAAAKAIKEQNPGVAGFVARTDKSAAVSVFASYLFSFGSDYIDKSGNSGVGSDEAKKAYAFYGGLIRNYGPDHVSTDMGWPEALAIFSQGKAGLWTDADSLYPNLTDPAKSKVSDKVGFAPMPAGPAGFKVNNVPAWALGVNASSKNKANAWKFIEWATSADMTRVMQQAGILGARTSVADDPKAFATFPKGLASAIAASTKKGVGIGHFLPLVINVQKARDIVGAPIVTAIKGGDSNAAADTANTAFQQLIDGEKK